MLASAFWASHLHHGTTGGSRHSVRVGRTCCRGTSHTLSSALTAASRLSTWRSHTLHLYTTNLQVTVMSHRVRHINTDHISACMCKRILKISLLRYAHVYLDVCVCVCVCLPTKICNRARFVIILALMSLPMCITSRYWSGFLMLVYWWWYQDGEDMSWEDLPPVAGVMIGREAWARPWMLRCASVSFCTCLSA